MTGKTDAKCARISADRERMRADLQPVRVAVVLLLLTSHRLDVIHDRGRAINRLRATMLDYFPALGRNSTTPGARPDSPWCLATRPRTACTGWARPGWPRG
ncbi:MAG: transposase [Actinomycetales bacterium]